MPIYEYRCNVCGATSEYLIGVEKNENIACKKCGSSEVERILSVASFMGGMSERAPGRTCCGREERPWQMEAHADENKHSDRR